VAPSCTLLYLVSLDYLLGLYIFKSKTMEPISRKKGILPRSIGRTLKRIAKDLGPQAEEEFVNDFRNSRNQTRIAVRFLVLLIIIPILTQQLSKQFIVSPLFDKLQENFQEKWETPIFLNQEMEEKAFKELKTYETLLKFESLTKKAPELTPEIIEEKTKEKAKELSEEFRKESRNAIFNVVADFISVVAFTIFVSISRKEIEVVKSFLDTIFYGLSDSAKAFLIILFTDIFVGFHSPHGWEVLLEGAAEHLGVAANHSGIFLFIATFPVALDTIIKYWIFRYLSRLSPSALATYKEMNE
jgi:CemA family